jgi:hypothetical protein
MKALMILSAFMLGLAGLAVPAGAQTAQQSKRDAEITAPFVALKDALIENVGTSDTVILLFGVWTFDGNDGSFRFFVRYRVPGTNIVRIQGARLGDDNIQNILTASHTMIELDSSVRIVAMVIDHGKVTVSVQRTDTVDSSLEWEDHSGTVLAKVYPGLTIEPYNGPSD